MWYIYTVEYYSAVETDEIVLFVDMWMTLETVIQCEVSQKENKLSYINLYTWNLEK